MCSNLNNSHENYHFAIFSVNSYEKRTKRVANGQVFDYQDICLYFPCFSIFSIFSMFSDVFRYFRCSPISFDEICFLLLYFETIPCANCTLHRRQNKQSTMITNIKSVNSTKQCTHEQNYIHRKVCKHRRWNNNVEK